MVIFHSYVSLPEGSHEQTLILTLWYCIEPETACEGWSLLGKTSLTHPFAHERSILSFGSDFHVYRLYRHITCVYQITTFTYGELDSIYLIQSKKKRVFKCYNNQCSLKNARLEILCVDMCCIVTSLQVGQKSQFRNQFQAEPLDDNPPWLVICFVLPVTPQLIHLDMEICRIWTGSVPRKSYGCSMSISYGNNI